MAVDKSATVKYIPMIPQHSIDSKFHYKKDDGSLGIKANCTLVRSIEELRELAKEFKNVKIAVDTETTGLSFASDFIVGFSISKDAYSGIYVPIRHEIKRVDKRKTARLDEQGNVMYTKANKPRQMTVEDVSYFPCESNLPDKEALDILYDIMLNAKGTLLHNSEFDLNMIKKEGYDVTKLGTFDTMILPYIFDPEGRGIMGLKKLAKILGRHVPEFKDVLGKEDNFRYVDPELGYEYACYDTMNTFYIFEVINPMVQDLLSRSDKSLVLDGSKYNIKAKDNELIKAFVDYYGHAELKIDKQVAIVYKAQIIEDLKKVSEEIYSYFNRGQFNLNTAAKEFKDAMSSKEINTGFFTEKGAISFGKDGIKEFNKNLRALKVILSRFDEVEFERSKLNRRDFAKIGNPLFRIISTYGDPYFKYTSTANGAEIRDKKGTKIDKEEFKQILDYMFEKEKEKLAVLVNIQKNSSLNKAMNAYVDKLTKVDSCRMKYKLLATSSSRLASGNGARSDKNKNDYYIDLNAQNLTKPKSCFYEAVESNEEGNILGYVFTEVSDEYAHKHKEDKIIVEGSVQKGNIRSCIVAPEGRYIMSRDYSSQEYLALAILSKDTKMLTNFKKGLDPHTSTAYAIWGEENYTKDKRKKAKTCLGDNSFIQTANGLIRPYDLRHTHMILDRFGNNQSFNMEVEKGDLIEVTYSTGIVEEYTPNHKVYTWNGKEFVWKEVQNLEKNDEVVQMSNINNATQGSNFVDTSSNIPYKWRARKDRKININSDGLAYLAGLYVGRGRVSFYKSSYCKSIQFKVPSICSSRIRKSLEKLGIDSNKFLTEKESTENKSIFQIKHSALSYIITEMFGKRDKFIPDYVFKNWGKVSMSNFMAGMCDSKFYIKCNSICYATKDKKLMQNVCLIGSLIGFKTNVSIQPIKSEDYYVASISNEYVTVNFLSEVFRKEDWPVKRFSDKWSLDKEFAENLYDKYKDWSNKNKWLTKVLYSIKNDKSITDNTIKFLHEQGIPFPIENNMQCAKVASKKSVQGNIYVIQTDNHEYVSSCIVSHNCNFLMNYGGGKYKLADNLEIPIEEAEAIIKGYEEAFFECVQWKKNEINKMYERGNVVFTEFGRPRQFGSWVKASYDMLSELPTDDNGNCLAPMEEIKAKRTKSEGILRAVERRVASHQIQGLCGDICRYVLLKLYKTYFKNRNPHIDFISTVHDEINFTVDKDMLVQYARECEDIMKFDVLRKDLPIATSLDVGYSYGNCFPFVWTDNTRTKLIPKTI